ncbi:MAG TPA: PspC domain-containing protein [Baekduia sp.]|nr:PspC domain-containing protein [Baekduia sp.]
MPTATHPQVDIHDNSLPGARAWFAERGLSRPDHGRLLAGVSAGWARRYDLNPLVARLLVLATVLILTPLVYVGAWILMPKDGAAGVTPPATRAA